MGVAEPPRGYGLALGFIAATTGNDRAGKQQLISPRLFPTVPENRRTRTEPETAIYENRRPDLGVFMP
jgi:hypothetical protein